MHPSVRDSAESFRQSARGPVAQVGDHELRARPSAVEHDANLAASDWQIILHLKAMFEREPALIPSLMDSAEGNQPAAYLTTLITAVREAVSACPDSADLHYHAGGALLRIGKMHEAETLLGRALTLNPGHADTLIRLAEVCMGLKQPQRAATCLRRALATDAVSADTPPRGPDRRGDELPA